MIELSRDAIQVTDHCVLRYLERAMGLNVEIVRQHILGLCGNAAAYGASAVRAEGLRFVIRDGRIVTAEPDCGQSRRIEEELATERRSA